jgi:hypothetical protein
VQRRRAEEAGAPVHLARNPRRTRTARSSHNAVKLNGPVPESISSPARSFRRPHRPSR